MFTLEDEDHEGKSQKSAKSSVSDDDRPKHVGFADKLRLMSKNIIPMPTIDDELGQDDGVVSRRSDSFGSRLMKGAWKKMSMTEEEDILIDTLMTAQTIHVGQAPNGPITHIQQLIHDAEHNMETHPIFCEMLLLDETEESQWVWKESARWIKYEETVEEGGTRFSKPYITNLTIQSILQIRNCLRGSTLLDVEPNTFKELTDLVTNAWTSKSKVSQTNKVRLEIALMARKQHLLRSRLKTIPDRPSSCNLLQYDAVEEEDNSRTSFKVNQSLLKKLPPGTEAAVILVGRMSTLSHPLTEFVRLRSAQPFSALSELPIPVRFVFILMFPMSYDQQDALAMGKSMGTLMVDDIFSQVAYHAKDGTSLAAGVEEFLSQSIIFPPGKWHPSGRLEPQDDGPIAERCVGKPTVTFHRPKQLHGVDNGLRRTGRLFGGFVKDIKRKSAWYSSDFTDMFKGRISQTLAASVFLFFANVTNIITFGGVMGQLLDGYMGAIENLLAGGLSGIVYALFSGQPLCILSATGPTLAFEVILYDFCLSMGWNYMPVRFWVGVWTAMIIIVIVAFDISVIIALITRFTEEAFATLIAVIFIVDGFKELIALRKHTSVLEEYQSSQANQTNWTLDASSFNLNATSTGSHCEPKEDVFMFSMILFIGTYVIAMGLKKFRYAPYLPGKIRETVSDFNVLFAIVLMTGLNVLVGLDVPSLNVPSEFKPTRDGRNWIINPLDTGEWWVILAATGPAFFLTILIFMDQQITSVIVNRFDNKLKKGYGYHLDLFVLAILIMICALFGLPYYVSATVLGIMHLDALRLMSESAAPGEKPIFLGIKEQRMTALIAHVLIALSILLTGVIRLVPMPVLLGIFIYMGVVTLIGQQFFQRFLLLFMPIKYQPDFLFLRLVKLSRIHFFTLIQLVALGLLFAVKTIKVISMEFPLMLIVTVLIRFGLERVFTKRELKALDDPLPPLRSLLKPVSRTPTMESLPNQELHKETIETETATLTNANIELTE